MPKEPADCPLLILGHGFMSSCYLLKGYAEYLSAHGIACCIFDFCGGSNYSRSDGSMQEMSVMTQVTDMKLLIGVLKKFDGFDTQKVYIGGESQGGLVAALTAAELKDEIAGLILLYPALYIPEVMRAQFPNRAAIPNHIVQLGIVLGRRYAEDVYDIDVYSEISKFTGKVLLLHGDRDGMVPLSYSQQAETIYRNAELVVIPGAGHGIYSGRQLMTACRKIEHFMTAV